MICPYCEQEVNTQFCPHCGARQELPKQPPQEQITPEVPQTPVNVNVTFAVPESFTHVCPRCGSRDAYSRRRGFRWGLALLGFFLIPGWGLLLGCLGSKKTVLYCPHCKKKFKLTHP